MLNFKTALATAGASNQAKVAKPSICSLVKEAGKNQFWIEYDGVIAKLKPNRWNIAFKEFVDWDSKGTSKNELASLMSFYFNGTKSIRESNDNTLKLAHYKVLSKTNGLINMISTNPNGEHPEMGIVVEEISDKNFDNILEDL